jgi:hypothetical protein
MFVLITSIFPPVATLLLLKFMLILKFLPFFVWYKWLILEKLAFL